MSRKFGRGLEWPSTPVSAHEIAPHKYVWNTWDDSYRDAPDYDTFKAGIPYKQGEVIWVQYGNAAKRAIIVRVGYERDGVFANRREVYKVALETAKGMWSKIWYKTYPGLVQRGYQLAGLAPEMPTK